MRGGIEAVFDGQRVLLEMSNSRLLIKESAVALDERVLRRIELEEIATIQVKSTGTYLLRLQLKGEAVVLEFANYHLRDLMKSLLLASSRPEQDSIKEVLERDAEMRQLFSSVKDVVSPQDFWGAYREKLARSAELARQSRPKDLTFDAEEFVGSLSPVLLKVLSEMNCSLNQFYNLLNQSYFCNPKNEKNSIDRLLSGNLRGYEVRQDFASRINSYSLLAMQPPEEAEYAPQEKEGRPIEFEPIYPFVPEKRDVVRRPFAFSRAPLVHDVPLAVEEAGETPAFEQGELVWIRDLSRVAYRMRDTADQRLRAEIKASVDKFVAGFEQRYGRGSLKYLRRILPTSFVDL